MNRVRGRCSTEFEGGDGMTLDEAIRRNPYNPKKGNEAAYCRYLRYNVEGWYQLDSTEVFRRWQKVRIRNE